MPIYTYVCKTCGNEQDKRFNIKDYPKTLTTPCPECTSEDPQPIRLHATTYCRLVTHGGGLAAARRHGRISDDQVDEERKRLKKRSHAQMSSKEGIAERVAQKERLEKRWGTTLKMDPFTRKSTGE